MRFFAFSALLLCSTAALAEPAPVSQLVKQIDIPFERFTLPNGLRVVVHTDRKAPVVAVSVWYGVGSKDEPRGKTGFAHLFEHLMYNGSENAPEDFFVPLAQAGATDSNGSTSFDRTNYYETVPTNALDLALFLESDRMGHLLGAVTQAKLDNQRGVVQNEKRQGDNQPFGLTFYEIIGTLFPQGHPYHHLPIGSMADLDAASLADVKSWFRTNYGPSNAVLVLAGDIDAKTAWPVVQKWFGDIPRGPAVARPRIDTPTLAAPVQKLMKDRVATTRLYRLWAIPGMLDPDATAIEAAAGVLGGLSSSRLDNALVRREKLAVGVTAVTDTYRDVGFFYVSADVRPGVDPAATGKRLDAIIADFMATGPTADELTRYKTRGLSSVIGGLEEVGGGGGKATALAQGELFAGDAGYFKKELARLAALQPGQVKAATQKWLSRPVFALTVEPGEREAYTEAGSVAANPIRDTEYYLAPGEKPALANNAVDRSKFPAIGPATTLDFPAIERTTLTNGIPVFFARRATVPKVQIQVSFDVGYAADPKEALGTQALMLAAMDEGTTTRNSIQIAEEQERLGASISSGASLDRTIFSLSALTANFAPSLDLLADIVRNPAFEPQEVERVRNQQLTRIASELTQPSALAARLLPTKLYGPAHPYGIPASGLGDATTVKALKPADLAAFHRRWLRPDTARVFVVGDTTLAALKPQLERSFGRWPSNRMARPTKNFAVPVPAPQPRIYLIDRPNSPQSVIVAGHVLAARGRDDLVTLRAANEIFGGDFLSRLNTDLRETKGWAYGVRSGVSNNENDIAITFSAPVQADRTGDTIRAFRAQAADFLGPKGVTAKELDRVVASSTRELPGSFESSSEVLAAIAQIVNLGRPDDYYETLAQKYRALDSATLDATARAKIDPAKFVYVVVGDAKKIRPQLDGIGLPVEDVPTPAAR